MSNRNQIPEPDYGLFEQLFATIFLLGYHVLLSIASLARK